MRNFNNYNSNWSNRLKRFRTRGKTLPTPKFIVALSKRLKAARIRRRKTLNIRSN